MIATQSLTELTLPAVLENASIALTFTDDATVGVTLTEILDKGGLTFAWTPTLDDTGFNAELDGKMWKATLTASDGTAMTVGPADALTFRAFDASDLFGADSYLFVWTDIFDAQGNSYWFAALWQITAADTMARARCWMGRCNGRGASINTIWFPYMVIKGPCPNVVTHIDGQKNARVLAPTTYMPSCPTFGDNTMLWLWAFAGATMTANHPNGSVPPAALTSQHMQFMAISALNSADAASYLRSLYVQTTDTAGYRKQFQYTGLNYTGDEGWLLFAPIHWPRFAQELSGSDRLKFDEGGNEYGMPYDVRVGAYTALSQATWWDACERYRDWVDSAMGFTAIGSNPNYTSLVKLPSLLSSYGNAFNVAAVTGPTYWDKLLTRQLDWHAAMVNDFVSLSDAASVIHSQYVLKTPNATGTADIPVADAVMNGFQDLIVAGRAAGVGLSLFIAMGYALNGQVRTARLGGLGTALQRDGTPETSVAKTVLFAEQTGRDWVVDELVASYVQPFDLAALYGDLLSGNGNILNYWQPGLNELQAASPSHGGNGHSLGKGEIVTRIKQLPGQSKAVFTEYPEETLIGYTDLCLEGYNWLPGQMSMSEDAIGLGGATANSPLQGRDWHPPVFQAVYHEYQPSTRYGMALSNAVLATHAFHAPASGLTSDQMRDLFAFTWAGIWVSGMRLFLQAFLYANHDFPLWFRDASGALDVDPVIDPDDVGLDLAQFWQDLYAALAVDYGSFLISGRMLRPLTIDYGGGIAAQNNPIEPTLDTNNNHATGYGLSTTPFFYDPNAVPWNAFAFETFDVPQVLHSVWELGVGEIAVAIVNWSNVDVPDWLATVDPTLYGGFTNWEVFRRQLGDVDVSLATGSGTFTVGTVGLTPDVDIGALPERSVAILRVVLS